jgi:hypothetical protein
MRDKITESSLQTVRAISLCVPVMVESSVHLSVWEPLHGSVWFAFRILRSSVKVSLPGRK